MCELPHDYAAAAFIRILYVTTKFMKSAKIKGIVCVRKNIRYINK